MQHILAGAIIAFGVLFGITIVHWLYVAAIDLMGPDNFWGAFGLMAVIISFIGWLKS
jgi:hypothetical protein